MTDKAEKYAIWLPENHQGSRRVSYGGKIFDMNKTGDEFKDNVERNYHEVFATKEQIDSMRSGYGFAARKLSSKVVADVETPTAVDKVSEDQLSDKSAEKEPAKTSKGKGK